MGKMCFPQITEHFINVIPNWSGNIIFAKFTPVEYSILCINEYKQVFVYCMKNSNHCRDDIIFKNLMSCPTVSPISALCSYLFTDTIKPGFSQNKIKMESIIKQILGVRLIYFYLRDKARSSRCPQQSIFAIVLTSSDVAVDLAPPLCLIKIFQ